MKLCKSCRWHSANFAAVADACSHPRISLSPVDGTSRVVACETARLGACGPEGRLFEGRPLPAEIPEAPFPGRPAA